MAVDRRHASRDLGDAEGFAAAIDRVDRHRGSADLLEGPGDPVGQREPARLRLPATAVDGVPFGADDPQVTPLIGQEESETEAVFAEERAQLLYVAIRPHRRM